MAVAASPRVQNYPSTSQTGSIERPEHAGMQPAEARMIYVAGGNVRLMEQAALSLFHAGHIPVLGQWFWPLVDGEEGQNAEGRDVFLERVAQRLLARCDAVLRVDQPSPDVDAMIGLARTRGLRIFFSIDDALAG